MTVVSIHQNQGGWQTLLFHTFSRKWTPFYSLILIFSAQYCLLFPGKIFLSLSFFVAALCGLWDLSSLIVIKLAPPALGTWSLKHWKIREVPDITLISMMFPKSQMRWGGGLLFLSLHS